MRRDLAVASDEQPLEIGARVELYRHVYGHVAGAQGVVVRRPAKGKVKIRFDDTGYEISMPADALKSVA